MSVTISRLVWEQFDAESLPTAAGKPVSGAVCKLVLLALADYASDDGRNIYPSINTLTRRTLLARRSVINALNALKTAGVVSVDERGSQFGTNEYVISVEQLSLSLKKADDADSAPDALGRCTTCTYASAPSALNPLVNPLVNPRGDAQNARIARAADATDTDTAAVTDTGNTQRESRVDQTRETMSRLSARGGLGADWALLAGGPVRQLTPEELRANEVANAANQLPPDCRGLATAYMTATGQVLQLPHVRRDTRAFREMLRDGVTPDVLSATVALMQRQGLAIAAPYSVIGMARDQAAQRARQLEPPAVPEIPQAVGIERIEEGRRRLAAVFGRE
jgi:hypothetical protein